MGAIVRRDPLWDYIVVIGAESSPAARRRKYAMSKVRSDEILDKAIKVRLDNGVVATAYNVWKKG